MTDSFIEYDDWKKKLNPMEKKKLEQLDKEGDELWTLASGLENERNRLRNKIQPVLKDERDLLISERQEKLNEISDKIRVLKESRKEIWSDFRIKSEHIRKARKEQLNSNPELSENLEKKKKTWDNFQKKRQEFSEYYTKLYRKYASPPKTSSIKTNSQEGEE